MWLYDIQPSLWWEGMCVFVLCKLLQLLCFLVSSISQFTFIWGGYDNHIIFLFLYYCICSSLVWWSAWLLTINYCFSFWFLFQYKHEWHYCTHSSYVELQELDVAAMYVSIHLFITTTAYTSHWTCNNRKSHLLAKYQCSKLMIWWINNNQLMIITFLLCIKFEWY